MNYSPDKNEVKALLETVLLRHFGCTAEEASRDQMYKAAAITVKNILSDKRSKYKKKVNEAGAKRVYYMCMEFLVGRSLKTNLCNLGLDKAYSILMSFMNVNPMRDLVTEVLADLPPALWTLFQALTTLQQAFQSVMNTDFSVR